MLLLLCTGLNFACTFLKFSHLSATTTSSEFVHEITCISRAANKTSCTHLRSVFISYFCTANTELNLRKQLMNIHKKTFFGSKAQISVCIADNFPVRSSN